MSWNIYKLIANDKYIYKYILSNIEILVDSYFNSNLNNLNNEYLKYSF